MAPTYDYVCPSGTVAEQWHSLSGSPQPCACCGSEELTRRIGNPVVIYPQGGQGFFHNSSMAEYEREEREYVERPDNEMEYVKA